MPIYIIQAGEDGPVKIGTAYDPYRRLASFQNAHFAELRMLAIYEGEAREEHLLHKKFEHLRIRGEWFRFDPVMLEPGIPDLRAYEPTPVEHELLADIETHLSKTGEKPSLFGRRAIGDPSLVLDLKCGRSVRKRLRDRIVAAINMTAPTESVRE